ncbi:TrkH family potassium uptake protein [Peptostreptococcus equinus]|uniref:TrkH family potassium uptake protein n=1 Tax=Peptostreptococcus equinus TaxID=3003601 RepID=A0ABY7JQW3_9FIRM|nr:TrkH family potassium uptake protein [Peptostreptococcus sp. CBA3647]WAW15500.1 TrkH family potassium uptake protein [Peptostreptococcus sp. CBA3647]
MKNRSLKYPSFLHKISPAAMMVLGFATVIFIGALLLMTPLASKSGDITSFIDCLFTATSAVCVTGLVVVDTGIHWSIFGKIIIIMLIQIGGIGFMSISTSIVLVLGRKVNLKQRILIKESLNQNEISGAIKLVINVLKFTFITETLGALILSTVFIPQFGLLKGAGFSVFHSISAFCNAGFDLMGPLTGQYSSIVSYYNNPIIVFTITSLIILGGLGFLVMANIFQRKRVCRITLTTKLVLTTTLILIIAGTVLIMFGEFNNKASMGNLSLWDKFQLSYFQSVTTRTAGFATADLTKFKESTLFIMIILMFIGASPASTGGGIKTTTLAVIFMGLRAFLKNENEITAYRRRINVYTFRKAMGVLIVALTVVVTSTYLLNVTQSNKFSLLSSAFEVSSAFATVGLSLAGSFNLNLFGKILIIILMFAGRVGSLTLVSLFVRADSKKKIRYAEDKVIVG